MRRIQALSARPTLHRRTGTQFHITHNRAPSSSSSSPSKCRFHSLSASSSSSSSTSYTTRPIQCNRYSNTITGISSFNWFSTTTSTPTSANEFNKENSSSPKREEEEEESMEEEEEEDIKEIDIDQFPDSKAPPLSSEAIEKLIIDADSDPDASPNHGSLKKLVQNQLHQNSTSDPSSSSSDNLNYHHHHHHHHHQQQQTSDSNRNSLVQQRKKELNALQASMKTLGENKVKRFWGKVDVVKNDKGSWNVNLIKNISLKAPHGGRLDIPNEMLAQVIALEWENQGEYVRQSTMPITDMLSALFEFNPEQFQADIDSIKMLLRHDPLCIQAEDEAPSILNAQRELIDPILRWFEKEFNVETITIQYGTAMRDVQQPHNTLIKVLTYLRTKYVSEFIAFRFIATLLDSVILALAFEAGKIDIDQAIYMSNIEKEEQIRRWGEVEGFHDVHRADVRTRIAAAVLFKHIAPKEKKIGSDW